jgi:hypothetical protein
MKNWPALILAPALVLAEQSATYALVTPSCGRQSILALHVVAAVSLVLALGMTLTAWPRRHIANPTAEGDASQARERFLAVVATMVGGLSSLAIVALWIPNWIVSPCAS